MSNRTTYAMTWDDGEWLGSLHTINEAASQRRPAGFPFADLGRAA